MNLAYFIARRIARTRSGDRPGVMERIAVAAVAVGIAVMVLTLAVVMGFKQEIGEKIAGFSAHVQVADRRNRSTFETRPMARSQSLEQMIRRTEGFVSVAPYAVRGGIIRNREAMQGLMLKGVDSSYDRAFFERHLVEGSLPRIGEPVRNKDLLIARTVAEELMLSPGDKVEMLLVEEGAAPRRDQYRVSGIFDSGLEEMDRLIALTDLRNVQRLLEWSPETISGYQIRIDDIDRAGDYAERLQRELFYSDDPLTEYLSATSVKELYPTIFDWLKAHDVNAAVVIVLMIVVALFNLTSALLVMVMERTRMVGLLSAMGMGAGALRRIFLYRALRVILRGAIWGNAAGVGLCLLQRWTGWVRLDSAGYLLSRVPVDLSAGWWLALNAGMILSILLLLLVPASIVRRIRPAEAIRYT